MLNLNASVISIVLLNSFFLLQTLVNKDAHKTNTEHNRSIFELSSNLTLHRVRLAITAVVP